MKKNSTKTISIIGLGYVGLPLAIEFSRKFNVVGFDKNQKRIIELKKNIDVTSEVSKKELRKISNTSIMTSIFKFNPRSQQNFEDDLLHFKS